MFRIACSSRCNYGYGEPLRESLIGLARVALLGAVMVHRGEEQLSCAPLLRLVCPAEELLIRHSPAAVRGGHPPAVALLCINCNNHKLIAVSPRNLLYKRRIGNGCAIERNLVCSCIQQTRSIVKRGDAAAHSKGDINSLRNSADKCAEGLATLLSCAYIQIDQLIGPFGRIRGAHLHGVAHIAQPLKVYTLNRNAILNIKTRDYPLSCHLSISFKVILSSKIALPTIAAGTPAASRFSRSAIEPTPPLAVRCIVGKRSIRAL